jgi:hypothetical protein
MIPPKATHVTLQKWWILGQAAVASYFLPLFLVLNKCNILVQSLKDYGLKFFTIYTNKIYLLLNNKVKLIILNSSPFNLIDL